MEGWGALLAKVLSRPKAAWASLALASGAFVYLGKVRGVIADGPLLDIALTVAWAALLFSSAFLIVLLVVDAHSAVKSRPKISERIEPVERQRLINAPADAQAIVAYLAVKNEPSIWLMLDHPGTFDFRSLGFGVMTDNFNGACELTLHDTVRDWLQDNLSILRELAIPVDATERLARSGQAATTAIRDRWMAY